MEDVKDLLDRLKTHVDGIVDGSSGSSISDEELKRQINAIYSIYAGIVGSEQIIVQASRYNALKYIHDENPRVRLVGMERLILESRDYTRVPTEEEIPGILDKLEDKLAEMLARQAVERQLEEKSQTDWKNGTRNMWMRSDRKSSMKRQEIQRHPRAAERWRNWKPWTK